jgi:hypothetical protein
MTQRLILFASLVALGTTLWWSTPRAQDRPACTQECRVQEQECIDECGERNDPIECEADCRDAAASCLQFCSD